MNGKPLLKQFGDLTPNDFNEYPVWVQCHTFDYEEEWCDETDEETFRPWIGMTPVSPELGMFLIKAELKLKNGETYSGFVTPSLESEHKGENDLGLIQPQIFVQTGERIGFWTGMFPEEGEIERFYRLIGKRVDE